MLFGGRFLRFMEGVRHKGSVSNGDSEKGFYNPLETSINFVVPSEPVLTEFCPIEALKACKNAISPGVIEPILKTYASNAQSESHVLSFDSKKIIPNTAQTDLLGCEDSETLKMQESMKDDNALKEAIANMNLETVSDIPDCIVKICRRS